MRSFVSLGRPDAVAHLANCQEMKDDLRIRRRVEDGAPLLQLVPELLEINQVPVVRHRDLPKHCLHREGLQQGKWVYGVIQIYGVTRVMQVYEVIQVYRVIQGTEKAYGTSREAS